MLTQETFDDLLKRLDVDRNRAAEKYEAIRRRLVKFFQWEGRQFPEDLADQTIDRVTAAIAQRKDIHDVNSFSLGVARMLVKESLRNEQKRQDALAQLSLTQPAASEPRELEAHFECLEKCLQAFPVESRKLILQYHQGEKRARIEQRNKLADALGITPNALRNRALRLREKLEECVEKCLGRRDENAISDTNG